MMYTAGNCAVVERTDEIVLCGARGVIARWSRELWVEGALAAHGEVVDFAALADPPRLVIARKSRGHGSVGLEMIDVATGEVQRRVEQGLASIAGIAPGGDVVIANSSTGVALVDGDGRVDRIERGGDPAYDAAFDRGGTAAIVRKCFRPGHGVVLRIDLRARKVAWSRAEEALDYVVDEHLTRGAFLLRPDSESRRVELWNLARGSFTAVVDQVSHGPPAQPQPRALEGNADLTRLCVRSDDNVVDVYDAIFDGPSLASLDLAFRSTAPLGAAPARFDVARGLILVADGVPRARLLTLHGKLLCTAPSPRACFGADGNAYSLSEGVVHRMTARGLVLVDGPSGIVDLAPHPRGLVAIDRSDCVHVIELDVEEART